MILADAFFNPLTNSWSTPTRVVGHARCSSITWTPTFYTDLEGSVGADQLEQPGRRLHLLGLAAASLRSAPASLSPHAITWLVGADIGWNPVTNLNFDLELMYQST